MKVSCEWCKAAGVSSASLKRFCLGESIGHEAFVSICKAVGVDWQEVVDLPQSEDLGSGLEHWVECMKALCNRLAKVEIEDMKGISVMNARTLSSSSSPNYLV